MSATEDGGPAFPVQNDDKLHASYGMTLRDYFAANALPAVIATYHQNNGPCIGTDHLPRNTANIAYRIADAMLAGGKPAVVDAMKADLLAFARTVSRLTEYDPGNSEGKNAEDAMFALNGLIIQARALIAQAGAQ